MSNYVMANTGDGSSKPTLIGSVSDALSKKPVKGVSVRVTSSLSKTRKSVTTDAFGKFSISALPEGELTIILEKKGYKTYKKEKVMVKDGKQLKLNIDMFNDHEETTDLFHPLLRMMES